MQLYVLDRSKNVLATTEGFYNDLHHKELTAGASTYVFDLNKSDEATQYMVSGNIITMLDDQGRPWSFEILYYDEYQTYKTVHCEDVGINLFNKACDVWYYTDAKPFADYFNVITAGTPWELGVNQLADLSRALTFTGRDTGLGRLLSVLKAFDNAECRFHVQMNGPVPVKYVIDVYKQIGTVQDNIQIAYNEELDNIQKTETRQEFVTALAGVGSVIQDTETDADGSTVDTNKPQEYVDFIDLEYDDGDFYTTKGDKFLRARTANAQFNPGDQGYIEDFYEYDTKSSTELFNRTLTQIQTRSQPQFTYDAQVKVIDPRLDIGDTVTIIDHDYNPALYLQARVATLEKSYTDATKGSITFTNYVVLTDTVTQQIAALRSKVNGIKNGSSSYVWIRYADDDQGTGISQSPKDKTYVAILAKVNQPVPSDDPKDYAGHWVRIAGEDGLDGQIGPQGKDGAQGIPGKDGVSSYTHIAYANSNDGATDFNLDYFTNAQYIGLLTDTTQTDSTDHTQYTWSRLLGNDGTNGKDGTPGKAGADGKTPYFHVAYSNSADGATDFTIDNPDGKEFAYLGTYTDYAQADSSDPKQYAWAYTKGVKGDEGIAGKPGVDGKTSYTHIAYANSATGEGFSEQPTGKTFIGMYVDFEATDSTDATKYKWSLIKGEDGSDGIPGKAGADGRTPYFHVAYADSADGNDRFYVGGGTNLIHDTSFEQGLWKTVWNNPSMSITADGNLKFIIPDTSQAGIGVSAETLEMDKIYTLTAKVRGLGEFQPYIMYSSDGNFNIYGSNGMAKQMINSGTDFVDIKYTFALRFKDPMKQYSFAVLTSGAAGNWLEIKKDSLKLEAGNVATPWSPAPSEAHPTYMGTYTDFTQADSLDPTAYLWSRIKGETGANGKDGQDAYLHIAYANSVDGKTDFTTDQDQAHNRDYLGTYSDNTKAQSTDPTHYTWQLMRGPQGLQGQPGSKDVPVVTMSSTVPPSPKDGDFWYQTTTDSSGQKITGFSVYSGGKWVPSKIDQSTLVLTKLVSIEIDSATINSPDITVPFDYFDESQNEYKGSMEFKDGMLKHISTMTGGGMLKTVVSPTGYTLDAYANQSEYTKNNPYIHTEMYADNISLSNANTKKSGILDSSGIGGTLNNGTNNSIGINMSWADVQKYLSEMGESGTGRTYDWFDIMSSVRSHPNLLHNSTFINGKNNWDTGSAGYVSNGVHDGNFVLQMSSAGGSNFCTQTLTNFPWEGNQLCVSFWANIMKNDGGVNAGALIMFTGGGTNYTATIQGAGKGLSTGWKFYSFNPITVPDGTSSIKFAFYNNEHKGNIINFAQPMLNTGPRVAPYMPTY